MIRMRVISGTVIALGLLASPAYAWQVGTQLGYSGCHEPITAQALRNVRMRMPTAPAIAPTQDEAALFADVQFSPPDDMVHDVAGMSLLLGVRDPDLKGENPLSGFDVVRVHGDPTTQDEHCIRGPGDDGEVGEQASLAACRAMIHTLATGALDGLAATGAVDASMRAPLGVYVSIAGHVDPMLPVFYVKMGQALHTLEDGFTHTYRTEDGLRVHTVLNWIEYASGDLDEGRDGPPHMMELDDCELADPIVQRNYDVAIQAATELLATALDPSLSREAKIAGFQDVTARYLGYEPGCDLGNNWCNAPEAEVTGSVGCSASTGDAGLVVAAAILLLVLPRRRRGSFLAAVVAMVPLAANAQRAPPPQQPSPPQQPKQPGTPIATAPDQPAVPPTPVEPADNIDAAQGKEPGRDVKTPTIAEVRDVREDKRLGSKLGIALNAGASVARAAAVGSVGLRYRINEKWLVGLGAAWNPWITTAPLKMRAGVVEVFATGIRRYPMRYDRVNLRTSVHAGTSTLLFDVYGAPEHSTGLFLAGSLLGLDYDLGNSLRLVVDPAEMAIAIPSLGDIPLWYEQFRFMLGIQYGS